MGGRTVHLTKKLDNGTHIVWGTGGSMVPQEIMTEYYRKGAALENSR